MTALTSLVDVLLPGDDVLPSGSAAGVTIDEPAHRAVLDAIERAGGGAEAVRAVERAMPGELAALLLDLVERYYDSDPVIAALGWTTEPPHPRGHPLPAFDADLLATVRRREPMWRRS